MSSTPHPDNSLFVLSVGGSLIVPEQIDVAFLARFRTVLLEAHAKHGHRFIVVTGGGKVCRYYQAAARELGDTDDTSLDWLGITITLLNAELVKRAFGPDAYPTVISSPERQLKITQPVAVAGGWKPGASTDIDLILLARRYQSFNIINLSNTDYIYDRDPNRDPDAKPLPHLTWSEYMDLIPKEWQPGFSSPFDPVAARLAAKLDLTVAFMNGQKLDGLAEYLNTGELTGSLITPQKD